MFVKAIVRPAWAVPGSRIRIESANLPIPQDAPPDVRVGGQPAHVVVASPRVIRVIVPEGVEGTATIAIDGAPDVTASVDVARVLATGVHQVDSPTFDGLGRLYVTHSGGQGSTVEVPIYRVGRDGVREPVAVAIANPTALVLGPDGAMYVSSRFEHTVHRLTTDDKVEVYAGDLGVPTGLAFARDGSLYVGDRSGSVLRVSPTRDVSVLASLPPSVAAFHLAVGPDDCVYVAAPTLAPRDVVYRITPGGDVTVACEGFGRPQGLAFDSHGDLYVVDALAGSAGLFRVNLSRPRPVPELVVAAPALVGVAFDPEGGVVLASNDTIWRLEVDLSPLVLLPS